MVVAVDARLDGAGGLADERIDERQDGLAPGRQLLDRGARARRRGGRETRRPRAKARSAQARASCATARTSASVSGSTAKAGSSVGVAKARCSSAVRRPMHPGIGQVGTRTPPRPGGASLSGKSSSVSSSRLSASSVKRQASPWLRTNCCSTASAVGVPSFATCSATPRSAGVFWKPAVSVRKRADLELRMDAALEPAVELQDHPRAEGDRGVALLGAEPAHVGRIELHVRVELARRPGSGSTPSPGGTSAPALHRVDERDPELGRGCGAVHEAHGPTAPHPRDGVGHQRLVLAALLDGKRHEVELPLVAAELHRDARQEEGVLAGPVLERRDVKDADCGDRLLLVAEPAPPRDEARRDRRLEGGALASLQQRVERAGEHEREQLGRRRRAEACLLGERTQARTSRSRRPAASGDRADRRSAGNRRRRSSPCGTRPLNSERSSCTACGARETFATHRMVSPSCART